MWTSAATLYCNLLAIFLSTVESVSVKHPMSAGKLPLYKCPCKPVEAYACERNRETNHLSTPEVVVITDGSTKFHHWNWDSLTTVVADEGSKFNAYPELMCYAKAKGKKYGIMETSWEYSKLEEAHIFDNYSKGSHTTNKGSTSGHFIDFMKWMNKIQNRTQTLFADLVVLNLLPVLSGDNLESRNCTILDVFVNFLQSEVKMSSLLYNIQFHCVVPDRPVYFADRCDVTQVLGKICDKLVINPDSFQTDRQMKCRAKAAVPVTGLLGAIEQYMSHGIDRSQIIVGISWHGFEYKCETYEEDLQICSLPKKGNTSECDFTAKRIPLRNLVTEWKSANPRSYNWSQFYQAPFVTTWNATDNSSSQLWYENMKSLTAKYSLIKELKLAGVSVWTAEDLPSVNVDYLDDYDENMWAWIKHTILGGNSGGKSPSSIAGSMAGVGIACVLIGAVLGFVFACALNYKRNKKGFRTKEPFETDDDFRDTDDLNLNL